MGADGGTLAKRSDTVTKKKRPEKLDLSLVERARWFNCALSNSRLVAPIVADRVGNLFNKEELVKALLEKRVPAAFRHVRSLRDVFELHFHANADVDAASDDPWVCPIALVPVGALPFVALHPCGHVVSERAWRELNAANDAACPQCAAACTAVRLNLPKAELDAALAGLLAAQDAEQQAKRAAKKRSSDAVATTETTSTTTSTTTAAASTSSTTVEKADNPDVKKVRTSASTSSTIGKEFTTESAAFKSLFTSSKQ